MSILKANLENIPKLVTVEPGEYQVRIAGAPELKERDDGSSYVQCNIHIEGHPDTKGLRAFINVPGDPPEAGAPDLDIRRYNGARGGLRVFYECFGIEEALIKSGQVDLDTLAGEVGWAVLIEDESPQYGLQNKLARFIVPKS